jgi:hypothetical protein
VYHKLLFWPLSEYFQIFLSVILTKFLISPPLSDFRTFLNLLDFPKLSQSHQPDQVQAISGNDHYPEYCHVF